ncbi:hypothetical protein BD324DRAFT_580804 [Kockovaella imperatae]|uniref:Cohesin loading factor-domain-containing protein n=1 Tax=Kockovaella imperatae TaxID=4999 RepID=A0A1Y1UEG6_9TREE|nr:hypothetical protein BD324DRAFT_580804 [Kockovaella imperatae]ORX36451.1 hypothetical protein BD324DRAFT_580804 [Kockovaella imperatae]
MSRDDHGHDGKRRRIEPLADRHGSALPAELSLPALLHMALSAHASSSSHLQQVFIPKDIQTVGDYDSLTGNTGVRYRSDPEAAAKSFALLLFALDLLHIGLRSTTASDAERVAFAQEFATVAIKVATAWRKLADAMSRSSDQSHKLALSMLLLELDAEMQVVDKLALLDAMEGQDVFSQWLHLVRLHLLFAHRRWDLVPKYIAMKEKESGLWNSYYRLHLLLYQTLWYGRLGDDASVKKTHKEMYLAIDRFSDPALSTDIRRQGAVFKVSRIAMRGGIIIQSTPLNELYLLTYLASVVTRRDFLGTSSSCKSLVLPAQMEAFRYHARSGDMWDTDFSSYHSLADAAQLYSRVLKIRVETLLEQVSALMYRSEIAQAHQSLGLATDMARTNGIFAELAPHFCLTRGQYCHLFGKDQLAQDSYRAAKTLLRTQSELGLIVDIGALGASRRLLRLDATLVAEITTLADRCRNSSNASLEAYGHFLGSLIDRNRVGSKKKLSNAYEVSQRANNNVLRCLIFAFTTSVHLYGTADRTIRQLETGRELARLMGGRDRPDGVGQLALGLWFAQKLKVHHRREGNMEAHAAAKADQERHQETLRHLRLAS